MRACGVNRNMVMDKDGLREIIRVANPTDMGQR